MKKLLSGNKRFLFCACSIFSLFIVVNVILVYLGFYSWSGKFTGEGVNKYNIGANYNSLVKQLETQKEAGWQGFITYPGGTVVEFALKNKDSLPILNKKVILDAKHSSNPKMDAKVEMVPFGEIYRANLQEGFWYLSIIVEDDGVVFLLKDEVLLRSKE